QIEGQVAWGEKLRNGHRTHHEAWLQSLNGSACAQHQLPDGNVRALLRNLVTDQRKFGSIFHYRTAHPRWDSAPTSAIRNIKLVETDDGSVERCKLRTDLFMGDPGETP